MSDIRQYFKPSVEARLPTSVSKQLSVQLRRNSKRETPRIPIEALILKFLKRKGLKLDATLLRMGLLL